MAVCPLKAMLIVAAVVAHGGNMIPIWELLTVLTTAALLHTVTLNGVSAVLNGKPFPLMVIGTPPERPEAAPATEDAVRVMLTLVKLGAG